MGYTARTTYGNQYFQAGLGIFLGLGLIFGIISLGLFFYNKKKEKKGTPVKVQRGFAIIANIFFSLLWLIIGTFNFYPWYVGAIIITLFMGVHMALTFNDWYVGCCSGHKGRTIIGLVVSGLVLLALIFVACYLLSGVCIGFHPDEFSFVGSRAYNDQCKNYSPKPCHFYLLFGKNVSSEINVIFQSYKQYQSPVLWFGEDGITYDQVPAETRYFSLLAPFTYRWIYYADLSNLSPDTTYYVQVGDSMDPSTVSDAKKFKTGPADDKSFTFAIGGDVGCEAEFPEMTSQQVASQEVLFLAIGGDIAYANGLPGCYWRWDTLLFMWEKTLITPSNYTIPFLFAIGNHEAGVAWGSYDKKTAPYYFNYLPFEPLNGRDPFELSSYHYHLIGNNTVLYSLDSEITISSDAQVEWIRQYMGTDHAALPNKLAMYHVPLYPGSRSITSLPIPHLREIWLPLFDEYHLKVAFENHDHVFLRSKPMLNDKENENGTLYIGDGAFGVVGTLAADTPTREYVVHAEDIRHFMFVEVTGSMVNITVIGYDGRFLDNVVRM